MDWVDDTGWLASARWCPSPNHNERPVGTAVDAIVLHGISLPPGDFGGDAIERLFTNRLDPAAHPFFAEVADLRVSSHLLIRRDGELVQFVGLDARAWHAGRSALAGRVECNDFAIGIELEGTDEVPYTEAQYTRLLPLLETLMGHYPGIRRERIVGHCHVAPGRKTDPGPHFEWERLTRALGVPVPAADSPAS
ncbi:1,6-anhydro-N-acetylmuramyl-L-alanine amidase AmpD [Arhodomonas aquaeolei]|uniref:1,6-anhydro-N-acetylmuramyl-L-alanine amidase AmpD n=1 Tax=Arhodomonas aquaeolei TaxID=2369 RepID=UPI00037CE782|nr:1,6-anhydro-N-acetylmuramyl-L-alanine amidase AmpD [Arhodomonas aquaeolei]